METVEPFAVCLLPDRRAGHVPQDLVGRFRTKVSADRQFISLRDLVGLSRAPSSPFMKGTAN